MKRILFEIVKMSSAPYDKKYQVMIDLQINWKYLFENTDYHLLTPISFSTKNNNTIINITAAPYVIFNIKMDLILQTINNFILCIKIDKINIITNMQ